MPLTLAKIFSRELVKDFFALFFRMSSLNLPMLADCSGITLFGKGFGEKTEVYTFASPTSNSTVACNQINLKSDAHKCGCNCRKLPLPPNAWQARRKGQPPLIICSLVVFLTI